MSIKTILFDLDGTLLPMDQEVFIGAYFKGIATFMAPYGYDPHELPKIIWAGTDAMIKNDGAMTNEALFWKFTSKLCGEKILEDIPHFNEFYATKFNEVAAACGKNPLAAEAVHTFKEMGFQVALATNPLFPQIATQNRIKWAGLSHEDFLMYTTYENSIHCKPNLEYYKDILKELDLDPSECLMVGNDVGEDMVVTELGMKVFLVTDCLINKKDVDISIYPHGDFNDLINYVKSL